MILVVDQTPGPLVVDIINSIVDKGEKVIFFCGEIKTAKERLHTDVKIIKAKKYNRETLLARIFTWLLFCTQYFFYLLFCKKPAVILAITNPPFNTLITSFVAVKRKVPFCLLIYDLYPEALNHAEMTTGNGVMVKLWKWLNRVYFGKANLIFTISNTMRTEIAKYVSLEKIQVVPNWADTDYIKPIAKEQNSFLAKNSLAGKKIILYAGNCGLTHDLESLIEAADLLKTDKDIFFLIVGEGAKKMKLQNMAEQLRLTNIQFMPYQRDEIFPEVMAAADIGIVTLGIGAEAISVPSKTYTNLAAGVCLIAIANENSELAEIISTYEVGARCSPSAPAQLANTIRNILSDETVLEKYKFNARKAVSNYTRANAEIYSQYLKTFC
jgi:glycosyltransferase involved in cell wall biosynthesis